MKLIEDIEGLLDSGVEAVTIPARKMRKLIELTKGARDHETGKLRKAMYWAQRSIERSALVLNDVARKLEANRKAESK